MDRYTSFYHFKKCKWRKMSHNIRYFMAAGIRKNLYVWPRMTLKDDLLWIHSIFFPFCKMEETCFKKLLVFFLMLWRLIHMAGIFLDSNDLDLLFSARRSWFWKAFFSFVCAVFVSDLEFVYINIGVLKFQKAKLSFVIWDTTLFPRNYSAMTVRKIANS